MASEGQVSQSNTTSEQDRLDFVQEALKHAQQVYASKQNSDFLVKDEPMRKGMKSDDPDASLTLPTGLQSAHKAVPAKSPSTVMENVLVPCQHAHTQLEAMGFERRRVAQALRAADLDIQLAVEFILSEDSISPLTQNSPDLRGPTLLANENAISPPPVATRNRLEVPHGDTPGKVITTSQKPINEALVQPQRLQAHKQFPTYNDHATTPNAPQILGQQHANKSTKVRFNPVTELIKSPPEAVPRLGEIGRSTSRLKFSQSLPPTESTNSKKTTAKSPGRSTLSSTQLEHEMQKLVPIDSGDQNLQLSDADFDRITELLYQAGQEEQSFRPRTYALLRMINAMDLLDDFVKGGRFDIALPYSKGNLPQRLSLEQRDHFLKKQSSVMTHALSIEGGPASKHAYFQDSADNHLDSLKMLGHGGSAEVDLVMSKLSRKKYVRKRLKREKTFEENARALTIFKREVSHMKRLSHRHMVRYLGSYTDPQYVGIIMEPVAEMDLAVFLSQPAFRPVDLDCIRHAFGCLCAAITYLKSQRVRHKDIKPENILIKQRKVFLTDFGIAINWKTLEKSTTTGEHGPISRLYAPPEVMENDPRNSSADIWSLGCVYLDMMTILKGETLESKTAYFLRNGNSSIVQSANREAFKGWITKLSSKGDDAPLAWIERMTSWEPKKRIQAQQLMNQILTCDERDYYGLCCDGRDENDVPAELRDSDIADVSDGEDVIDVAGLSNNVPDAHVLEHHLHKAVQTQDVKKLKIWLRKVPHLRNRGLNTMAIHRAVVDGSKEILVILLEFGCNLEIGNNRGDTPLALAVLYLHEEITEMLAKTKIALDAREPRSLDTALHAAIHKKFHPGVRILLNAGASVDLRNRRQETPLHWAVERGDLLMTELLLKHGADCLQTTKGYTLLQIAAQFGHARVVLLLLDCGAEIDAFDTSMKNPPTSLGLAISYNHPAVAQLLLERGANVNFQIKVNGKMRPSPLHWATNRESSELVEIVLKYKPDLELRDMNNETPLVIACWKGSIEIIQKLIAAGADVNVKVDRVETLVSTMIAHDSFMIAQLLIDKGAVLERRGELRNTMLHYAVAVGDMDAMDFLLKNNINIDVKDMNGITPLMEAARVNRAEYVLPLLKYGASIDEQDRRGRTALLYSFMNHSTETAMLLLESGADPLIDERDGYTVLSPAMHHDPKEMLDAILENLGSAGRIVHDERWQTQVIFLPLAAMQHDYELVAIGHNPHVRVGDRTFSCVSLSTDRSFYKEYMAKSHLGRMNSLNPMRAVTSSPHGKTKESDVSSRESGYKTQSA